MIFALLALLATVILIPFFLPLRTALLLIRTWIRLFGFSSHRVPLDHGELFAVERRRRGAPSLVLIHGLGTSLEQWATLLPLLSRKNSCYALDLPGFGRSRYSVDRCTVRLSVQATIRYLEERVEEPAYLLGNSFGGWIALLIALERPELIRAIILENTAGLNLLLPEELQLRPKTRGDLETFWKYTRSGVRPLPGFLKDACVRYLNQPATDAILRSVGGEFLDGRLHEITRPTLIIWGSGDSLTPLRYGERFHEEIDGSEMVVIEGASHAPHLQYPRLTSRLVADFIKHQESLTT